MTDKDRAYIENSLLGWPKNRIMLMVEYVDNMVEQAHADGAEYHRHAPEDPQDEGPVYGGLHSSCDYRP